MLNVELSLLSILCLASCDSYHVVDVIYRATTRKIVNRTGNTLKDRTDSDGTTQTLNELVADVTNLEVWNYQTLALPATSEPGAFLAATSGTRAASA